VHGLWGNNADGFHLEPKIKKPESIWLVGLDSESRFELALAVFVRERPLRPQAKVKSAHVRKDSEVEAQRQTRWRASWILALDGLRMMRATDVADHAA
jgi:hypothetical protein